MSNNNHNNTRNLIDDDDDSALVANANNNNSSFINFEKYEEDYHSGSSDSTSPPNSSISTGSSVDPEDSDFVDSDLEDEKTLMLHRADAAKRTFGRRRNRNGNPALFCSRATSLGEMKGFTDKMLLMVASYLRPKDVVNMGYVSWMFLVIAHDEPTWRSLVLNLCVNRKAKIGEFCYHGSWKRTMLHPKRFPNKGFKEQDVPAPMHHDDEHNNNVTAVGQDSSSNNNNNKKSNENNSRYWMIDSPHKPLYARIRKTDAQQWNDHKEYTAANDQMYLGAVERRSGLSYLEFVEEYERPNKPVILTDVANDWPAKFKWQEENFAKYYGDTLFNINCRSTKGYRFRMRMFDFLAYCHTCNAEKYMYVFDKFIFNRDKKKRILSDFTIPEYFAQDLFDLMDEDDRPDHRWILVGPDGSGSPFHTDPHASSAWNTVFSGAKRVTFYPPHVCPPGVDKTLLDSDVYPSDDNTYWYRYRLPRVMKKHPNLRPVECVVYPGETLFIPSMWWHSVMNIGTTIAVTQNFCSLQTFPYVAHDMNTTSGRGIRGDFKCGLSESQFKPLADYIVIHKNRPENKKIMQTIMESVISHHQNNGYAGAVNLLYYPNYGKKKNPVNEQPSSNDTTPFYDAVAAVAMSRQLQKQQKNNGNGGDNDDDDATTRTPSQTVVVDLKTISQKLIQDFNSPQNLNNNNNHNNGGLFGKMVYGNNV